MAGFNKVVSSYQQAMQGLTSGMTVIAVGFGYVVYPKDS